MVDFKDVKRLLEETRSVTVTAELLCVSQPYLSRYLNRKHRKTWWEALKKRWKIENRRERARRAQARAAGRDPYPENWKD